MSKFDIEKYASKLDLIQATAQQIIKDFLLFDEKVTFSGNPQTAYRELFEQIQPIINRLIHLDSSRFFALLYAIDVEEKEVRKILFGKDETAVVEEITKMIIERELMKVVYRKHWSKQL